MRSDLLNKMFRIPKKVPEPNVETVVVIWEHASCWQEAALSLAAQSTEVVPLGKMHTNAEPAGKAPWHEKQEPGQSGWPQPPSETHQGTASPPVRSSRWPQTVGSGTAAPCTAWPTRAGPGLALLPGLPPLASPPLGSLPLPALAKNSCFF